MNKSEREKRSAKVSIIGNKTEEGKLKINRIEQCKSISEDAKINAIFFGIIAVIEGIIAKVNLNLYYNDICKTIVSILLVSLGAINATRAIKLLIDKVKNDKESYNLEDEILSEGNSK